jgi:hypothetical protein
MAVTMKPAVRTTMVRMAVKISRLCICLLRFNKITLARLIWLVKHFNAELAKKSKIIGVLWSRALAGEFAEIAGRLAF